MTEKLTDDLAGIAEGKSSRRSLLRLGAVAVPAVITLKPAMATAQVSLAMCRIPIECKVDKDGKEVSDKGYAPPPNGYYYGEDLIQYGQTGKLPDGIYSQKHFEAHLKYIQRLGPGDPGKTCVTSLVNKI